MAEGFLSYVYICVCPSVWIYAAFAQVSSEARREWKMLSNQSYRELLATQFECWELNFSSLEEQQALLTARWDFSVAIPVLFFETMLSLNLKLTKSAKLPIQQAPGILLSPQVLGLQGYTAMPSFLNRCLGSKLHSECFPGKHFYQLIHVLRPHFIEDAWALNILTERHTFIVYCYLVCQAGMWEI